MPKRRIAFSVAALADLETIDAYISEHNPTAAARVLASIEYAISFLPDHPLMGVVSRDGEGRLLVEPRYKYVIAYTLTDELIEIRYVFHPRQDR